MPSDDGILEVLQKMGGNAGKTIRYFKPARPILNWQANKILKDKEVGGVRRGKGHEGEKEGEKEEGKEEGNEKEEVKNDEVEGDQGVDEEDLQEWREERAAQEMREKDLKKEMELKKMKKMKREKRKREREGILSSSDDDVDGEEVEDRSWNVHASPLQKALAGVSNDIRARENRWFKTRAVPPTHGVG